MSVTASRKPVRSEGRRGDRGAVLVETALTFPLVFLLIVGTVEISLMLRDHMALRGVNHEAVRAATVSGNDIDADFHILEVIFDSSSPLPDDSIDTIVIYRADGPDSPVPPACLLTSQSTSTVKCNLYDDTAFALLDTDFRCRPDRTLDRFWCPSDRKVAQRAGPLGPPDYIGIHLELKRGTLTGLFGGQQRLTSTRVLRLEPRDL